MLIIREPISLKIDRPIQGIRQDMAERMQANYGLMNLSIRKEELLHITSVPPEIYFAEGDNLHILTNINNQNQQEIRLDVINNLMNRIMVAQTENFTYQDTVYISNVLRKLGIRDEKTFMKQVFALQNEHKETRQLLKKYEANQEILQQLFWSDSKQQKTDITEKEINAERERRFFIHDEIFKRLETGKIYQDMRKFSKNFNHESKEIFPMEMQIAEQARAAENFLLQDIKNEVTGDEIPLYYQYNNQYEYLQEITEDIREELEEQISAAILLNLADQAYTLRQQQIEENSHYWYSIAGALFQTAENTWKRYEVNLMERKHFSEKMFQVLEEINHTKHLEGDVINKIVEEYYNNVQHWKEENLSRQNLLMQKKIQEDRSQTINISGGSYHLTQEELELSFFKSEEGEEEKEETALTVEQLQKQLEIYNQRNYENYQKITEIGRGQQTVKERKVNRRKAQMDALRALENPNEVLVEYITSDRKDPVAEAEKKVETQIYELFSEETKEIYRQYLLQNSSTENTFLQHIMAQPEESETRREVVQALKQIEQQEEIDRTKQEIVETVNYLKPVVSQSINEEIHQQLILWKQLQEYSEPVPEEEEVFQHRDAKEILHIQETKLTDLKETIENQIKRQQAKETVLNINIQKEIRNQQVDFVHKVEEKLMSDELLEELRMQNRRTVKTEQTEERNTQNNRVINQVVQETVNHVQTNRMEDIEEIVQQSVRRQLNNLSEQVYGKLEKKLQTERKRRGYF